MVEFVESAAEEAGHPVFGTIGNTSKTVVSHAINAQPEHDQGMPCSLCKQTHSLFYCRTFKKMRPCDRLYFATREKLCLNCLKPGHINNECPINMTCSVDNCGEKHTRFLHQRE